MSSSSTPSSSSLTHSLTPLVYSLAALFFMASAYNTISSTISSTSNPIPRKKRNKKPSSSSTIIPNPTLDAKSTSNSIVTATYLVTPEMCAFPTSTSNSNSSSPPFLRAGPLLKLIDICAGISSRRHASNLCVTISVDSVLILKPIYLGELIHISSCVNRSWNTSLEVGVRVVKENNRGQKEYVSHSYLTFVSLPKKQVEVKEGEVGEGEGRFKQGVRLNDGNEISKTKGKARDQGLDTTSTSSQSFVSQLYTYLTYQQPLSEPQTTSNTGTTEFKVSKPKLPKIIPSNRLEKRRHLLAGLRRTKRISDSKKGETRDGVSIEVKKSVRKEVMEMGEKMIMRGDDRGKRSSEEGDREIDRFELEFIARAFLASDPAVTIDKIQVPNQVIVTLEGDEPLKRSLSEVERVVERFRDELQSENQILDLPNDEENSNERSRALRSTSTKDKRRLSLGPLSPTLDDSFEEQIQGQFQTSISTSKRDSSLNRDQRKRLRGKSVDGKMGWDWEKPFVSGGGVGIGLSDSSSIDPLAKSGTSEVEAINEEEVKDKESKKDSFNENLRIEGNLLKIRDWIPVEDTLSRSIQLVFPEHANSASVLFGGQLMAWMESCAILSCLKLFSSSSSSISEHDLSSYHWSTVSMDGLEFPKAASIGEVMEFTSIVTKTFSRSCEVYVLVTAESQGDGKRFTNDVLLTLACSAITGSTKNEIEERDRERSLREVRIEKESYPALWEFSNVADDRRESRLEMRELLSSIYK